MPRQLESELVLDELLTRVCTGAELKCAGGGPPESDSNGLPERHCHDRENGEGDLVADLLSAVEDGDDHEVCDPADHDGRSQDR